jgi:RIO-like serine/threonine protein kinase
MACRLLLLILASAFALGVHAARLAPKLQAAEDTSAKDLLSKSTSTLDANTTACELERYPELTDESRFFELEEAGSGANGCVVVGRDRKYGGRHVAIKVSKKPGKLESWKKECDDMKKLRQAACTNDVLLKLAERYLPTCLEVGGSDKAPFIIMHAAPGQGIGASFSGLTVTKGEEVFAQLVGAVTAIHGIGYTHNDLHDGNVMIMQPGVAHPKLVLIDFGEVVALDRGTLRGGYKQDETVFAYMAGRLAKCQQQELYGHPQDHNEAQHRIKKEQLLKCLQRNWKISEEAKGALDSVMDEAFKQFQEFMDKNARAGPTQTVALYNTEWVQEHHQKLESLFTTPEGWCGEETFAVEDDVVPQRFEDTGIELEDVQEGNDVEVEDVVTGAEPETCATPCKCSKKKQYYFCLDGQAKNGCSETPWRIGRSCESQCKC